MTNPNLMSEFKNDFRYDAIKASVKRMEREGITDPWDAEFSYCLPTGNSISTMKRLHHFSTGFSIIALTLLVLPGICLLLQEKFGLNINIPLSVFFSVFAIGMVMKVLFLIFINRIAIPFYGGRHRACRNHPDLQCLPHINIENAATYSQRKFTIEHNPYFDTEDYAYLALDQNRARLIIEGILCRYLVRAEDVTDLRKVSVRTSAATQISFRVTDDQELELVLAERVGDRSSLINPYWRQTDRLYDMILSTFESRKNQNESILQKDLRQKLSKK
ncbi:MAG: hypothetical protein KDA65_11775 [Planctomycetaceae bacterium]|nr:hypothetical protein [Planctomycetaceae bacterium]